MKKQHLDDATGDPGRISEIAAASVACRDPEHNRRSMQSKAYRDECSETPWACTYDFLGAQIGITILLPTEDHDEAERLVRTTWPGVRVEGRLLEEIPAHAKQKG